MTMKKRAAACKTTLPKPTRQIYELTKLAAEGAVKVLNALRAKQATLRVANPLPAAHQWPPFLWPCYQQAFAEMQAVQALASAYIAYLQAQSSIPQEVAVGFASAKTNYLAAWGAMEDCLNMIV